jgi:hypothetical protein
MSGRDASQHERDTSAAGRRHVAWTTNIRKEL